MLTEDEEERVTERSEQGEVGGCGGGNHLPVRLVPQCHLCAFFLGQHSCLHANNLFMMCSGKPLCQAPQTRHPPLELIRLYAAKRENYSAAILLVLGLE